MTASPTDALLDTPVTIEGEAQPTLREMIKDYFLWRQDVARYIAALKAALDTSEGKS